MVQKFSFCVRRWFKEKTKLSTCFFWVLLWTGIFVICEQAFLPWEYILYYKGYPFALLMFINLHISHIFMLGTSKDGLGWIRPPSSLRPDPNDFFPLHIPVVHSLEHRGCCVWPLAVTSAGVLILFFHCGNNHIFWVIQWFFRLCVVWEWAVRGF